MTITVSISDFRDNLSDYLSYVKRGDEVIIKDHKRDEIIAQVSHRKQFDLVSFKKALRKATGIFTAEKHPEWRTKQDVIKWVEQGRIDADRTF